MLEPKQKRLSTTFTFPWSGEANIDNDNYPDNDDDESIECIKVTQGEQNSFTGRLPAQPPNITVLKYKRTSSDELSSQIQSM